MRVTGSDPNGVRLPPDPLVSTVPPVDLQVQSLSSHTGPTVVLRTFSAYVPLPTSRTLGPDPDGSGPVTPPVPFAVTVEVPDLDAPLLRPPSSLTGPQTPPPTNSPLPLALRSTRPTSPVFHTSREGPRGSEDFPPRDS